MPTRPLERLMFVQAGQCFFCEQPLSKADASVEHLLASANGGSNADENCVVCCKTVNAMFGSMSLKEKFRVILKHKGQFRCPNGVGNPGSKPKIKPTESEHYARVYENLKSHPSSRPRVIRTLTSTVAALLKGQPGGEATRVIAQLKSNGVIEVSEANKVTYKF